MTRRAGRADDAPVPVGTPLWGIGRYEGPDGPVTWEISHDEIGRDLGAAPAALARLGVGAGGRVLHCSLLSEAGHFFPLVIGTMLAGAQVSQADATRGDATRVAMFLRMLHYDAVLGVNAAILDGLDELGVAYAEAFSDVGAVCARPDAIARLAVEGIDAHGFALCGPAVAIAAAPGAPALVHDTAEWELGSVDGRITVTNLRARATEFRGTATAVRGSVVDHGVVLDLEGNVCAPNDR
ncbi:MAG TPA: hypothetical protein VH914_05550 [Acidimicrobiia bacterium]|nr:hypothetical protein [Acidimicrobiia bacterium]